jgi:hypothetical protein
MNAAIISLRIPRVVREPGAEGWLLIVGSFGWLFGSRAEALREQRKLLGEVR